MAKKRVRVVFEEKVVEEIDKIVQKESISYSEYFRRLAIVDLEHRHRSVTPRVNTEGRLLN